MSTKKKSSRKKSVQPTGELKTRCDCGQSLSYVDRQAGVCPCCGDKV